MAGKKVTKEDIGLWLIPFESRAIPFLKLLLLRLLHSCLLG